MRRTKIKIKFVWVHYYFSLVGGKFIKTAYGLIQFIGLARPKFDVLPQADDFDLTQVDPN